MNDMEYDDVIYLRNRYMKELEYRSYDEKSVRKMERQYKLARDSFIIKQLMDLNNNNVMVSE